MPRVRIGPSKAMLDLMAGKIDERQYYVRVWKLVRQQQRRNLACLEAEMVEQEGQRGKRRLTDCPA